MSGQGRGLCYSHVMMLVQQSYCDEEHLIPAALVRFSGVDSGVGDAVVLVA